MPAKKKSKKRKKSKEMKPWTKRALTHPELHTKDNESVRTTSVASDGKEVLFPTLRARGPGLERLSVDKAYKESVKRKDFIEFDTPAKATAYSKAFSAQLGRQHKSPIGRFLVNQRKKKSTGKYD